MDAGDALARDREHAERVAGAQVGLGREREAADVVEAPQIVRMHPRGIEGLLVVRDAGVDVPQGLGEAGLLQGGELVAGCGLDRVEVAGPGREVSAHGANPSWPRWCGS